MNNLKLLRKKRGLGQVELSNMLGITQSSYSRYEAGLRDIPTDILTKLVDIFGVTADEILGLNNDQQAPGWKVVQDPADPRFPPRLFPTEPLPDLDRETALIPILGSVRAGYDNFAEENLEGYMTIDERLKAMHPEAYVLTVKGDSMEPEIKHGDIVICAPDVEIRNDDVAIICVNGDIGTVKRVRFEGGGLTLVPANPHYRKLHYSAEDVESYPVAVQSKVIEVRHRYH